MKKTPWSVDDFFALKCPGSPELAPDGKKAVFTVQNLNREEDKTISRIFFYDGQDYRPLTSSGKDSSPRFSPDGQQVAFISNRTEKSQLFLLPLQGGEPRQLETEKEVKSFFWHPDGKSLIFAAGEISKEEDWQPYAGAPPGDGERLRKLAQKGDKEERKKEEKEEEKENRVRVINSFRYRFDGKGYLGHTVQQIYQLTIPAGYDEKPEVEQLTRGDYNHEHPALDPSGRYLVVVANYRDLEGMDPCRDLWIWDLDKKEGYLIYKGPGPIFSPHWSHCGSFIYFGGHDMQAGLSTTSHLWRLGVQESIQEIAEDKIPRELGVEQAENLLKNKDRPVGSYVQSEPRGGGGSFIHSRQDGVYFTMTVDGVPGIFRADNSGEIEEILYSRDQVITSFHTNEQGLIFTSATGDRLDEVYIFGSEQKEPITNLNGDLFTQREIVRPQEINYSSSDGQKVQGWVYYPSSGANYPLMLLIHGGPHGAYGPSFSFKAQLFASQGYVVFLPNPRGSESYGQEFARCIDTDWGNLDYEDIMAGVKTVVDRGNIDRDNLFAHGWSYGGYMACWLPTQTEKFKAICAGASVSNLLSGYGTSDITLSDEWEYGGKPWENPDKLMKHSPLHHVEKVRTPLLLMHGENDMRCPPGQSEEFFIALKRLGQEVVMIRYPDEFHGLRRPRHREDFYQRLLAWFNHYRDSKE